MKAGRVTILVGAGILLVIVLIVFFWVIPRAAADPEDGVDSFRTFAIADVCFGLAMLGATFLARGGVSTALLVIAGIGALLFGLWLLDGASSFSKYPSSMHDVAPLLFWCVGGEEVAGLLALVGAVLLARSRKHQLSAS